MIDLDYLYYCKPFPNAYSRDKSNEYSYFDIALVMFFLIVLLCYKLKLLDANSPIISVSLTFLIYFCCCNSYIRGTNFSDLWFSKISILISMISINSSIFVISEERQI